MSIITLFGRYYYLSFTEEKKNQRPKQITCSSLKDLTSWITDFNQKLNAFFILREFLN